MTKRTITIVALMGALAVGTPAACGSSAPTRLGGGSGGGSGGDDTSGVVVGTGVGQSVTGAGGAGGHGTSTGSGGGGAGGCATPADCNDSLPCTVDTCSAGACQHTALMCPQGQLCDAVKGCVGAMACATTAQCVSALGADACKADILCDPAQSICTYKTLDKDGDGYPPVICGGTDCDDSDPTVHPGAPEICDGKDNDCNGKIDDGAVCPGLEICQAGSCVCPPANTCGAECVDLATDAAHCGTCANACAQGASCIGSTCVCPANGSACNGQCVDLLTDPNNCGVCNKVCPGGATCQAGGCACDAGTQLCGGLCVDTSDDPDNCGICNKVCPVGAICQGSGCVCPGLELCGNQCVNTASDPNNCGVCSKVCPGGESCVNSNCVAAPLYYPSGPQTNVPVAALMGWTLCYQGLYDVALNGGVLSTIQQTCSEAHILMACAPTGAASYTLLAAGLRTDVFTETGTLMDSTVTHIANGVGWYFDPDYSWGFLPAADAPNNYECDIATTPDDGLRLCWHTTPVVGGYRCGAAVNLNGDTTTSRYVFQAP